MAFNLQNLTVNYRSLLRLTVADRVSFARSAGGDSWLGSLTPTQLADLFPSYYLRKLPDLGKKFLSGNNVPGYSGPSNPFYGAPGPGSYSRPKTASRPAWMDRVLKALPPEVNPEVNPEAEAKGSDKTGPTTGNQNKPRKLSTPKLPVPATSSDMQRGLADLRSKAFGKEIMDESVVRQIAALEKVEVGGMSNKSKLDWLETVVNRASAVGGSIISRLQGRNRGYWGGGLGNPRGVTDAELAATQKRLAEIVNQGRDETRGMTDNASNAPGNPLADRRAAHLERQGRPQDGFWTGGERNKGEFMYLDDPYVRRVYAYRKRAEEAGKAARERTMASATAVPKEKSKTGTVEPGTLVPQDATPVASSTVVPPLPSGLSEDFMRAYNSLGSEDEKTQFRRAVHHSLNTSKTTVQDLNKQAAPVTATPTAEYGRITRAPSMKELKGQNLADKFPSGTQRFFRQGGKVDGVDPKLIEVLKEASKDLPPGYHVRMVSGADGRSTGTKNHPGGVAVDLQIVDDQGKIIPKEGFGPGHKRYEQLAQSMDIRGRIMYPGTSYIHGGAWKGAASGYGDRMHYQIVDPEHPVRGASRSSGRYSFERGIDPSFPEASAYMDPKELQNYKDQVRGRIQSEREAKIKTATDPVAQVSSTGSVAPTPLVPPTATPTEYSWGDIHSKIKSGELAKMPQEDREKIYKHYYSKYQEDLATAKINPESGQAANNSLGRLNILRGGLGLSADRQKEITQQPESAPSAPEIPKFENGGVAQASGDNAYVIGETGKPLFMMNTEKERMSYDPGSNSLSVEPTHRTNTDALQTREDPKPDTSENTTQGSTASFEAKEPVRMGTPQWQGMMNHIAQASGNIYETASFHRAVAKSRFIEVGDSVKGGHYSYGASNLKWL